MIKPNIKLKPKEFSTALLPYAKEAEKKTGIAALAILAQAAVESNWNAACPGWMYFGMKDTDGLNGNEQLLTTTEYHNSMNVKYPVVISITPVIRNSKKMFRYKVKDYFRRFDTPGECFEHHGLFFLNNKRYAKALFVKSDPYRFFEEIAKAGYATDPKYSDTLKKVAKMIEPYL